MRRKGLKCALISPAHIPKASADRKKTDRIKTDRRDAMSLARLHRSGELTEVYVLDQEYEAIRDLTRARENAINAQRVARQHLSAMLLRLGFSCVDKMVVI